MMNVDDFVLFFRPCFFKKIKEPVVYWSFFMRRQFIHFYDSLNIVLILDPGCESFCAKCVQFPLMINLIKKKIFKSHLSSILVVFKKILSDLHMTCVILFHFTWLCLLLQWDWKVPIIKVIEIF